jgi:hypothetical protein
VWIVNSKKKEDFLEKLYGKTLVPKQLAIR